MHQHLPLLKSATAALVLGVAVAASPAAALDRPPTEARARIVRLTEEAPETMPATVSLTAFAATLVAALALTLLLACPERTQRR